MPRGRAHGAADRLLEVVARRLDALRRDGDAVARFGGDEFAVLCPGVGCESEAVVVADRIAAGLAEPLVLDGAEVHVRAGVGVAYARDGDGPETLLRDADAAMYQAEEHGRNRVEIFDDAMRSLVLERLETERALHLALRRGELELHFQPEWKVTGGRTVGVEALVRWRHPERGLLLPADFVPVAEERDLVCRLGEAVLSAACEQAVAWRSSGSTPVVLVNLAARQLADPDLVALVAATLEATGAEPGWIGLELTESSVMSDADASIATLERPKGLGVGLAVDDFGTGYSSLAYLKRLPVDVVEVDRAFVEGVGRGTDDAIVAAVVSLARTLGMRSLAEGVETPAQLAARRDLGCDLAQGYVLARPAPAASITPLLRAQPGAG